MTYIMNRTIITATTGNIMAIADNTVARIFSTLATKLFPKPAVETVEVNLVAPDELLISDAVPPPAIIAKVQVNTGFKSVTVETIISVPATDAKGMAILSKALSTKGM